MAKPRLRRTPPYPWYNAYMSALFEIETDSLERRISEAECELMTRERQIFHGNGADYAQERNAVTAALHALTALRACNGLARGKSLKSRA